MDQDIASLRRMIEEIRQIRELARQGSRGHVRTSLGHYRCRVRVTIDVIKPTMQSPIGAWPPKARRGVAAQEHSTLPLHLQPCRDHGS
jgi:hypothetical protein